MTTVELHQAFIWTCEDCGRDNFERAIKVDPTPIDADQLPDHIDTAMLEEWAESGEQYIIMTSPNRVTCGHCGSEFDTEEP